MIRDENGQSIVEMALVIPILLLLLVGVFDFGRMLFTYSALHFTAQETVRVASFGKDNEEIIQFAKTNFDAGDQSLLDVDPSPLAEDNRNSGDYITVTLSYPITPMIPVINHILPEEILLRANSTMRIE